MRRKILVALAALALLAVPVPAAASPGGDDRPGRPATSAAELQAQVDQQLKAVPGGKQTAVNEVSYGDGRFVVSFALPGAVRLAAADCPSGSFCFYEYTNFGYPRGRLSDPGWQDLATWSWYDRTDSVHNNTGTAVDFDNHTSGGHANDVFLFCVPAYSTDSDVYPYRNQADHVYRYYGIATC